LGLGVYDPGAGRIDGTVDSLAIEEEVRFLGFSRNLKVAY